MRAGSGSIAPSPSARLGPHSRAARTLLVVLSVIAGCTDVIGYFGLDGLFTSHITGNLLMLAAHVVGAGQAQISKMLAVPVYFVTAGLATLLADGRPSLGQTALRRLLLLQLLLLAGFLVLRVAAGPHIAPDATIAILAGMFGVSAMAVQAALVQISLKGMPPTAVMTSNVARFAVDVVGAVRRGDPAEAAKARARAAQTMPVLLGFSLGCCLGAACEAALGVWSLVLPAGLAAVASAIGFVTEV